MNHWENRLKQQQYLGLFAVTLLGMSGFFWGNPTKAQVLSQEKQAIAQENSVSRGSIETIRLRHSLRGHTTPIRSLVFSRDSTTLISGGGTSEPFLKFWSVDNGREGDSLRAQSSAILTLEFSPNGQMLVTSGEDADIHFRGWPNKDGKVTFFDHYSFVLALAVTPDSQLAVSGALDGIRVWTLEPPNFLYQLEGFGTPAYSLAMHPNGYLVASGDDRGGVRFWNIRERRLVSEFFPHKDPVSGLAITPDGKNLITASNDSTIKIWDIATGQLIYTLTGHKGRVQAIALSPDGKILASGSRDGVRVWSVEWGRLLLHLRQNEGWVNALAFSPNGRYLAAGGFDRVVNIWEVPASFSNVSPSRIQQLFNEPSLP